MCFNVEKYLWNYKNREYLKQLEEISNFKIKEERKKYEKTKIDINKLKI